MTTLRPRNGINLRLNAYDVGLDQLVLSQNMDMGSDEIHEQIQGSVKYHGANIGTNEPTAVLVNYNQSANKQDVLIAVDDKIVKKNFGANEFENLLTGMTPNKIRNSVNIKDKSYIAHPVDGLFEYDGISVITKINDIQLVDIITAKETNRCFGITKDGELVWTDDLVTMTGVPLTWAALNVDTQFPTNGDTAVKLFILSGRLIVLRSNSIWFYYIIGGPTNWRPEKVDFSGGCIAPQTAKQVGKEIWFLGYSGETGRGVYALDGNGNVRLLSYDVEPFLNRINKNKIQEAVAEYVNKIYKLSVCIDNELTNNWTLHFDTISINKDTGSPCIYGPHTYGFSASAVLNTTEFKGEHLFTRKHSDGARVFKVADYRTNYSDELVDNGSLIPTVLISPIISQEVVGKSVIDSGWFKKYSNLIIEHPPVGTWYGEVEVLKGFENETFETYLHYMEGQNYSIEALEIGADPLDFEILSPEPFNFMDITSDSIQFKFSNYQVNKKMAFRSLSYSAKPEYRKKYVPIISL
jgi:hypothetical protein